jgi:hypothetical protein
MESGRADRRCTLNGGVVGLVAAALTLFVLLLLVTFGRYL